MEYMRTILSLISVTKLLATAFAILLFWGWPSLTDAAPVQQSAPVSGEITEITITDINDMWSAGTMRVGSEVVVIPRNLLINLPNDYLTLQQLFTAAPAICLAVNESGLARNDACNSKATGAFADILANRTDSGNLIAGQVDIVKEVATLTGAINYIDYAGGWFRVNGIMDNSTTGTMVRINDPTSRHTIQSGPGCAAGNANNCSPDTRFKIDPDNYTFAFTTGYPPCIPSTVNGANPATGENDPFCPATNRPATSPVVSSNPPPPPPVAADSTRFAPIRKGDVIRAEGNYESIGGVTFFSASGVKVQVDLNTRTIDPASGEPDRTQPDYLFIDELIVDGPAYPAAKVHSSILTSASDRHATIDYFTVHYAPNAQNNLIPHEQILYTTANNPKNGPIDFNTVAIGKFFSEIFFDFFPGAIETGFEPCLALNNSLGAINVPPMSNGVNIADYCSSSGPGAGAGTKVENFNLMVPAAREVMARSRRQQILNPGVTAVDIHGNPTQSGQYKLPATIHYGAFDLINPALALFPFSFSGTPWLMDRRLSPNGCTGACESTPQPLDPFPFEGVDPREVSPTYGVVIGGVNNSPLPNPNRVLSFWPFGTGTTNPNVLAWPPINPGPILIVQQPTISIYPPITVADSVTGQAGVPLTIDVLANDIPIFGQIDPTTLAIATPPGNGTAVVNHLDNTITFTPPGDGLFTFTYTVANNYGSVSPPGTVSVDVNAVPVSSVTLTPGINGPQNPGTPITFIATASGGGGNYTYRFWLFNGSTWSIVRDYSATPYWTWLTNGFTAGNYTVAVDTKNSGAAVSRDTVAYTGYTLGTPSPLPFTSVTVSPSVVSPSAPPVDFQATGVGGSGTPEYNFWLFSVTSAGWSEVQPYSADNSWQLPVGTVAGDYVIGVNVRTQGSASNPEAVSYFPFTVQ